MASAAFRMTSGHDFVAGAVLPKHVSIFVEVSQKTLVLEVRIYRDPETEILHKLSHRILIQRSCTSGPRGS